MRRAKKMHKLMKKRMSQRLRNPHRKVIHLSIRRIQSKKKNIQKRMSIKKETNKSKIRMFRKMKKNLFQLKQRCP